MNDSQSRPKKSQFIKVIIVVISIFVLITFYNYNSIKKDSDNFIEMKTHFANGVSMYNNVLDTDIMSILILQDSAPLNTVFDESILELDTAMYISKEIKSKEFKYIKELYEEANYNLRLSMDEYISYLITSVEQLNAGIFRGDRLIVNEYKVKSEEYFTNHEKYLKKANDALIYAQIEMEDLYENGLINFASDVQSDNEENQSNMDNSFPIEERLSNVDKLAQELSGIDPEEMFITADILEFESARIEVLDEILHDLINFLGDEIEYPDGDFETIVESRDYLAKKYIEDNELDGTLATMEYLGIITRFNYKLIEELSWKYLGVDIDFNNYVG